MQRNFRVNAVWDEEDQLWLSDTDIRGLHIEAETYEEFEDLVREFASELIATNHFSDADVAGKSLREILPAVVISKVQKPDHAA